MKLNDRQKEAVLDARRRPGEIDVALVRVDKLWAAVWHEPEQPPAGRWRGQLVKSVVSDPKLTELLGDLNPYTVWWSGGEVGARTRREVVELLTAEALR